VPSFVGVSIQGKILNSQKIVKKRLGKMVKKRRANSKAYGIV